MERTILFLMVLSLFSACETGTKYDKNTTRKKVILTQRSSGAYGDIDALVGNDKELEDDDSLIGDIVPDRAYVDEEASMHYRENKDTFERGKKITKKGLDVQHIRVGKHDDYLRVVLDIYEGSDKAIRVGSYNANYNAQRGEIAVTLTNYSKFSAPLPSFSSNSAIKQIIVSENKSNNSYDFRIKLRQEAKVKIFDLKNPARLAFDIKLLN